MAGKRCKNAKKRRYGKRSEPGEGGWGGGVVMVTAVKRDEEARDVFLRLFVMHYGQVAQPLGCLFGR